MRSHLGILPLSLALASCLCGGMVWANPTGEVVRHGGVTFERVGNELRVLQQTDRAIIDWQSFSIAEGEITSFLQPGAQSAVLNRVRGGSASLINGSLRSNGQVILINPSGIIIGPTGRIDVGGLVASTLDVSDADFLGGGDMTFRGVSEAAVINLGSISAFQGNVYLFAKTVENSGSIVASNGRVGLASGSEILLRESGEERVFVKAASGESKSTGVSNSGSIAGVAAELKSYGGNIYGMAVKNEGRISATSVTKSGGQIFLSAGNGGRIKSTGKLSARKSSGSEGGGIKISAEQGTTEVGGTVDASGADQGGEILILGRTVELMPETVVINDGDFGGGTVRIGGGRRGLDPNLENASNTLIGQGTTVDVSARINGDAGDAVFFAEKNLDFYGFASARGGFEGGNGGFVELSGKETVSFNGFVKSADLSARNGKNGSLLFDPLDVVISGDPPMAPGLEVGDINQFLETSGSLYIDTYAAGEEDGNLTINSGVQIFWGSDNDLSFDVANDFIMESGSGITNTGGGSVNIWSDWNVEMGEGSKISVNSGVISIDSYADATVGNLSSSSEISVGGYDSITVSAPLKAPKVSLYSLNDFGGEEGASFAAFFSEAVSEELPPGFELNVNAAITATESIAITGSVVDDVFNLFADLNAPGITINGYENIYFDQVRVDGSFDIGRTTLENIDLVTGVGSADSLIGADTNQVYELLDDNEVYVDGFSYLNFEKVKAGSGNDQFLLDAEFTPALSINGGGGSDLLRGRIEIEGQDGRNDTFVISRNGAGSLNTTLGFSGFETLDGGQGNDQFIFRNQATVDFVDGADGIDTLIIDDTSLTGNYTYNISEGLVSRNPQYRFAHIEGLSLLLGSGNDTVNTTRTTYLQALNGGAGRDTLRFDGNLILQSPFSVVSHTNFEGPVDEITDPGQILDVQIGNTPPVLPDEPPPTVENNFNNSTEPTLEQQFGLFPGIFNAIGGAFSAGVIGQALVVTLQNTNGLTSSPAGIDGSPPPFGVVILLGEELKLGAYSEMASAIEFDGAASMVDADGPYAIDLGGPAPQDVMAALKNSLLAAAALELIDALDLGAGVPVSAMDGAVVIGLGPGGPDQATIALLEQSIGEQAFADLRAALGF